MGNCCRKKSYKFEEVMSMPSMFHYVAKSKSGKMIYYTDVLYSNPTQIGYQIGIDGNMKWMETEKFKKELKRLLET